MVTATTNTMPGAKRLGGIALLVALCLSGCGAVDPGEADQPRVDRLPDARRYGLEIHPMLAGTCGTAGCHAGQGPLQIVPADTPLLPEQVVDHPQDLPEPFRTGYYTVLGRCDLVFPEDSQLLRWATGEWTQHPGDQALGPAEAADLVSWLRSGGGD